MKLKINSTYYLELFDIFLQINKLVCFPIRCWWQRHDSSKSKIIKKTFCIGFSADFFTVPIIPQECQSYQIVGLWLQNLFLDRMRHFSRCFFGEFFHSSNHPTRVPKLPNCWPLAAEFISWKNETLFALFFIFLLQSAKIKNILNWIEFMP